MAFDGIFIHGLASEINEALSGGRLYKIQQTEEQELLLHFKVANEAKILQISVNPSLPLVCLTDKTKESPQVAPNFLMVLRKHFQNAKLLSVTTPGLERAITLTFEHANELGDLSIKKMEIELMGRYSNLILVNSENEIIDAIKRVPPTLSSVRTVLPGHPYFLPASENKKEVMNLTDAEIREDYQNKPETESDESYFCRRYIGFCKTSVKEFLSNISENESVPEAFLSYVQDIKDGNFHPEIAYKGKLAVDFNAQPLHSYPKECRVFCESFSGILKTFFENRNEELLMRNRTEDLRKILKTLLSRAEKNILLQNSILKDCENKNTFRLFGDLLTAYQYELASGEKQVTVLNYEDDNQPIEIPLNPELSIGENAKKYYQKYNKAKRTEEAAKSQAEEAKERKSHIESLIHSLNLVETENDLFAIRREMENYGYVQKKGSGKKQKEIRTSPHQYVTDDGFTIYVGKNNLQNEELTFKIASGNDYWFHIKKQTGSHVILKTDGKTASDSSMEKAAMLAAYYSDAKDQNKADVDYVLKKELKKVPGKPPGFVIYHTNFSMTAEPKIPDGVRKIK